jgi:hypothetical protein
MGMKTKCIQIGKAQEISWRMLGNQQLKCPDTSGILKTVLLLHSASLKSCSMVFCSDGCICKGKSSGKHPVTLVGIPQKSQDKCPTILQTCFKFEVANTSCYNM